MLFRMIYDCCLCCLNDVIIQFGLLLYILTYPSLDCFVTKTFVFLDNFGGSFTQIIFVFVTLYLLCTILGKKSGRKFVFVLFFCVFYKKKLEFFIFCFSKRHLIINGNFVGSFPLSIRVYYDFYGKNHFCKLFVVFIRKQNKKIFVEEKTERKMMRG